MKKYDFVKQYCEKSEISKEELLKDSIILECNCEDESCKGWAVVNNDKISIKTHNKLYK